MFTFATEDLDLAAIPMEFWIWGFGTVLLSAGLGFVAGMTYSRYALQWAAQRARKQVSSLYAMVVDTLEQAQDACGHLEAFPQLALSVDQTEKLETRRGGLLEAIGKIVEKQRERIAKQKEKAAAAKLKKEQTVLTWVLTPADTSLGLPSRDAFDANLAQLLDYGSQCEVESGFLLVKVDKAEQLKSRYGADGVVGFLKKMSAIIIRSVRDQDVVCRFSNDEFAVLLPDIDEEAGRQLAHGIRNTVRNHRFRLDENGPEVLVTASFGYCRCYPADVAEMTLDRAKDALSKSVRRGRNQLHVHDGQSLVQCLGA